jgi:hypothetical protein
MDLDRADVRCSVLVLITTERCITLDQEVYLKSVEILKKVQFSDLF